MTAAQTRTLVEEHNRRWAAGDLQGLFALYAPDIVFVEHYSGRRYQGAGVREHIAEVLRRSRLDSLRYTDVVRVDGDTATLQYTETIRSAGGDALLTVHACDTVRVAAGYIAEINEYAVPQRAAVMPAQRPPSHPAEKIGLSPRALGFLLEDLDTYMQRGQPYLDPGLRLQQVAEATGYSRNQISFALNQALGTGFFAFVNHARIGHLLRLHAEQPQWSVQALSRASGFRSLSTCYAAFRAATGEAPRSYFRHSR
ncbi:nuclear transport factor 2 family protein [Pseudorhodoferax sp.]|uniref:nuclear transport factor 2 family protein n=1 Tax=Pseudorhodoferax sp. TaxID=1993553 RepID=UPI002DD65697|nr:nuclear transport factor 2 family protein [Pseudorhodoferax sp.]